MKGKIKHGIAVITFVFAVFMYHFQAQGLTTKLIVAFDCNMPLYQFADNEGNYVGMHIDILDRIASEQDLILVYIPMNKYSDCIEALNKGEVDLVLGAMFNEHNQEQMTDEISSSALCLFVKNNLLDTERQTPVLSKETAVFEYGTASYLLISNIGASKYWAVGNQSAVFQKHMEEQAGAIIGVKDSILWQIYELGLEEEYTIANNYMSTVRYGILTQEGDYNLRRMLNNGLLSLRTNGEYDRIYQQWSVQEPTYDVTILIRRSVYAISGIIILWSVYAFFSYKIQGVLKNQVAEKTKELQNASDLQQCLIENSPNSMVLFDQNYIIQVMNNSAYHMAGLDTTSAPLKTKVTSLNDIDFFKKILEQIGSHLLAEEIKRIDRDVSMESTGGELHTYHCNVLPVDNEGVGGALLLTVSDITKEEQMKRLAFEKEKNSALNRMVAGIAHEIKNPLMSIRTFATLLTTRRGDQQVQDMFAEFVPDEVDRISTLIDGLLNYAKPSKGEVAFVNIGKIIKECSYLTQPVADKGYIEVEVLTEQDLIIQADKNQIKQVLINLILNAIESMEKKIERGEQGKPPMVLKIEARTLENEAVITMLDQGCGMSEKEVQRCIDPFFTTKATGSGLGLALSKNYIEKNGGKLLIESRQNEYTKITIKFAIAVIGESGNEIDNLDN